MWLNYSNNGTHAIAVMIEGLLENVSEILVRYLSNQGYSIIGNPKMRNMNSDISIILLPTSNICSEVLLKEMNRLEYSLPIKDISVQNDTISVKLNRTSTLTEVLQKTALKIDHPKKTLSINYDGDSAEDLTSYRIQLLAQTLKNLCAFLDYEIVENAPENNLYISSKSNFSKSSISNRTLVLCGSVLYNTTNDKGTLPRVSDVRSAKKNMLLQEMENKDKMNAEVASSLVDAIVKFDLQCVKLSKNVSLNSSRINNGASGSVVFIMYNYSRLNAILHEYESRITRKFYSATPPIEEIDFGALKKEEEWRLVRDFVMRFPTVLLNTMKSIEMGKPAPHLLCQFLYSLARAVSSYYRSTKILLDKQPSLMKLTFARVHLIKIIHGILRQGLEILNIEVLPAL